MNRKQFIRKTIVGTGILALVKDELKGLGLPLRKRASEIIGFNHLPTKTTKIMSNIVLHKANTRGHAQHGWLDSYHTFSFANYYDPERMHFGALRVLNDDEIEGGMGFGTHPHDNMEIITIVLEGALEHKDSMGNTAVIRPGEIQVMSAGTGIQHSEYNKLSDTTTKLLQIWVFPNKQGVKPRYDQIQLQPEDKTNQFQQILSPNPEDAGVWIHQNAWFHLSKLDKGKEITYTMKDKTNGVYAFVLQGSFSILSQEIQSRDGLGITSVDSFDVKALAEGSELLLMEVPMNF